MAGMDQALTERPVSIRGCGVDLRPVTEADYPVFYSWRADANFAALWYTPSRRIPTYEEYLPELERFLVDGMTLLLEERRTNSVIGFARLYNINLADGWAWVQWYVTQHARKRPYLVGEAALLFADRVFYLFPLRKLYSEVHAYNKEALRLNERLGFHKHGLLPEHVWLGERYWDVALFSLTRDRWLELRDRFGTLIAVEQEAARTLSVDESQ